MDLVSRLKQYLDSRQISVTQFADECLIPRPTASQLLAGRNKKVSDEIISKIHNAYPDLNVVWLMFGEGNMLSGENIRISDAQKTSNTTAYIENTPDSQTIDFNLDFNEAAHEKEPKKISMPDPLKTFTFSEPIEEIKGKGVEINKSGGDEGDNSETYTVKAGTGKRVTGIVVYYDDCTYESFVPDPTHGHPFMR